MSFFSIPKRDDSEDALFFFVVVVVRAGLDSSVRAVVSRWVVSATTSVYGIRMGGSLAWFGHVGHVVI